MLLVERPGSYELNDLSKNIYMDYRYNNAFELSPIQDIATFQTIASELKVELNLEEAQEIRNVSNGNPLFAVLLLTSSDNDRNLESLLDKQIERLKRQVNAELSQDEFYMLAMAVLTLGLPWGSFPERESHVSRVRVEDFTSQDATFEIPPLKPDIFGGYLLLSILGELKSYEIDNFVSKAWCINPNSVKAALYRVHNDFKGFEKYQNMLDNIHSIPKMLIDSENYTKEEILSSWMYVRAGRLNWSIEDNHVVKIYSELKAIAQMYPDKIIIQLPMAHAMSSAVFLSFVVKNFEMLERCLEDLEIVFVSHSSEQEINLACVKGFMYGLMYYTSDILKFQQNYEKTKRYFSIVKENRLILKNSIPQVDFDEIIDELQQLFNG